MLASLRVRYGEPAPYLKRKLEWCRLHMMLRLGGSGAIGGGVWKLWIEPAERAWSLEPGMVQQRTFR